jgi:hypothetical protein
MPTENVVIKFTSDTSGLKDSVAELQKIGKLSDEDAKKFQMMEGFAEGIADALKEAGVDAKTFNKEIKSATDSGKSLRTQFMEARNEAVKLSREFGATSTQARNAAKSAALLKDEIDDMNAVLGALNPEAKLNAFVNLGQGVQGAFQAATGALQVFGVENERITKLAQQFQGVLNLTQGINSVLQLKDVYTQLRLVLGVTTAAQNAMTTATAAGTTATTAGTVATRGFTAALAANPITAAIIALTALAAAVYAYTSNTEDSTEATAENNKELEEQIRLQEALSDAYEKQNIGINRSITDSLIKLRLAKGEIGELQAQLEQLELNRQRAVQEFVRQFGDDIYGIADINRKFGIEAQIIRAEAAAKKVKEQIADIPKRLTTNLIQAKTDISGAMKELSEEINKALNDIEPLDGKRITSGIKEEFERLNEQVAEINRQILNQSLVVFDNLLDSQSEGRIKHLEDEKKRGLITEEAYAKEVSKIKRRQALQDRAFAVFQAFLALHQTILSVLKDPSIPSLTKPPLIAAYSALAAAQITAILATPLPKFKKGTLNVGGGNVDSDGGMHAIIHKGEAVIPADRNKEYHPTIKALYNRQVKASDINSFVQMKLAGKMNHNVNAKINTKELARAMSGSDNVNIKNTSVLARQIGREIASNINRRRS